MAPAEDGGGLEEAKEETTCWNGGRRAGNLASCCVLLEDYADYLYAYLPYTNYGCVKNKRLSLG